MTSNLLRRIGLAPLRPGTVEGTLGKTTIGATTTGVFSTQEEHINHVTATEDGTMTKLTFWATPNKTGGAVKQKIRGVVYSDVEGTPTSLLAQSATVELTEGFEAGWVDLALEATLKINKGVVYWIGVSTGPTESIIGYAYDTVP